MMSVYKTAEVIYSDKFGENYNYLESYSEM